MTDQQRRTIAAPGKLFLCGEYGALLDHPALVMATERRAYLRFGRAPRSATVLPDELSAIADPTIRWDASELVHDGRKIGIGSSSAAAACAALVLSGGDLLGCWRRANTIHALRAPAGSQLDVAAAVLGGVIALRSSSAKSARLADVNRFEVEQGKTLWPMSVVLMPRPARTSGLIARGQRHQDFWRLADEMGYISREMIGAAIQRDAQAWLRGVRKLATAYQQLGAVMGVDLLGGPTFETVRVLSERHHGACKPSGAGGGDVVVAFFAEEAAKQRFDEDARDAGITVLTGCRTGVRGVGYLDSSGNA